MIRLNIKGAIESYNKKHGGTITQAEFGALVIPEEHPDTYKQILISSWGKGKRLNLVKPTHIIAICEASGIGLTDLLHLNKYAHPPTEKEAYEYARLLAEMDRKNTCYIALVIWICKNFKIAPDFIFYNDYLTR